jgi:hypothetical protein
VVTGFSAPSTTSADATKYAITMRVLAILAIPLFLAF